MNKNPVSLKVFTQSDVLPKYASVRRFFARLASEIFLSSLQSGFFSTLLEAHGGVHVLPY